VVKYGLFQIRESLYTPKDQKHLQSLKRHPIPFLKNLNLLVKVQRLVAFYYLLVLSSHFYISILRNNLFQQLKRLFWEILPNTRFLAQPVIMKRLTQSQ
jgi:hypothetical protein